MTDAPDKIVENLLSTETYLQKDSAEWRIPLMEELTQIKDATNEKSIGKYSTLETYTGDTYFKPNDNNKRRYVFRKVIDVASLPNNTTINIPHGINVDSNTVFTHIYGAGTSSTFQGIPLPYVDIDVHGNGIELAVTSTIVSIKSNRNWSDYSGYVVLNYLKN